MNADQTKTVIPKPAATVVLARDQENGLQVLLLQRSAASRFMAGNYVFPGGLLENADYMVDWWQSHVDLEPDEILRRFGGNMAHSQVVASAIAAIRETFEEAGVLFARRPTSPAGMLRTVRGRRLTIESPPDWLQRLAQKDGWILQLSQLFGWSRWITPEQMRYRYDTRIFIARMPEDQIAAPDMRETVHATWVRPEEALRKNLSAQIPLGPPTLITLHEMLACESFERLKQAAEKRRRDTPLKPRLITDGKEKMILEPWDPEYHRSQVRFDVTKLRARIATVGAPFSRLWFSDGVWKPVVS